MKYEMILFDADETLFDFRKSEQEAIKSAMLDFNFDYDEDFHLNLFRTINTGIWGEFEKGQITQAELKVERFRRLARELGITFDADEFANTYMKHLANGSYLFEDSIDVLDRLYGDYKLMIITNGLSDVQEQRIKKSVVAKYFEDIVVSEELGISKPDPGIFDHALRNVHIDKSKVLMVGDSLTSDIQGGINFGIDTCWYNPRMKENIIGVKPTYEIVSLMELVDLIKE